MDVNRVRSDFPILQRTVRGKPFIYFDNACVTLKPRQVVEAIREYYEEYTACHGRSMHAFAIKTTEVYEKAHETVGRFIGAKGEEIVFTKNTTEAINLVANALGFKRGDKVLTTKLEHNSNLIPWMKLAKERGVVHEYVEMDEEGKIDMEDLKEKAKGVKLASFVFTSNATGTTQDAKGIAEVIHERGGLLLLDAAQTVAHQKVDVGKIDVDLLAFSGHKMLGPSGTGALYGKRELLESMEQFIVGGDTVSEVLPDGWKPAALPGKYEAGLQNYAGAAGFAAAAKYLMSIGMDEVEEYERGLAKKLYEGLKSIEDVDRITGPKKPDERIALASFTVRDIPSYDIAMMLDESANIFIRAGMHCTHLYHRYVIKEPNGTARASLYIYNTKEEIERFLDALREAIRAFKG